MTKFAGSDWVRESLKRPMSALGEKAADILGATYRGIYHLPTSSLKAADWADPHNVRVWVPCGLSTYDGMELASLVILAHDACVRLEIMTHGPRRLMLWFSHREGREGTMSSRHPTIEQAIVSARGLL